ncbi:uncharacterized protein LOC143365000, partial [Halictus rubicundus]
MNGGAEGNLGTLNGSEMKTKDRTNEKLSEETIDSTKVKELREKLRELQLAGTGNKNEMRVRLKNYLRGGTEEEEEESEDEETDDDSDENMESAMEEDKKHRTPRRHTSSRNEVIKFTIKDVDNSIPYFTGDDKLPIKKWVNDFEELSALLEWNDLQKLLYGKRMMKGSAKQFVTYEKGIVSWQILKKRLLREFKAEMNGALIDEELRKRKRRPNESARQYVGAMQGIASQGSVEEDALIEHIINGIQDREHNKTMLYAAMSLHELRRSLELYDRRKEKEKDADSGRRHGERKERDGEDRKMQQRPARFQEARFQKKMHCFSCGGFGNARTVPVGIFKTQVRVGNNDFDVEMFTVPNDAMSTELILGQDFLKDVQVQINQGEVVIKKNYRELNRQIIKDRFPMSLIEDCIDSLSGARVFSVLELKNGFFHVPVAEESRKYTSFVTPDGQYEFVRTPFGLCNSPTSFLRFIDNIFSELPTAMTELHTDASSDGYGAVLLQKACDEKVFHPVHYMSKKTTDAERKYSSYELELLAIVRAVQKFRVYLLGLYFAIITDCQAVQKTLYKKDLCPRVARWALTLEEFHYKIEHRSGERLKHVDALSRYPVFIVEDKMHEIIRKTQNEDERIRAIKQRYGDKTVVVLPTSMFVDTIRRVHENGHFGVKKVVERIKEEFYIPNLSERVER